MKKLNEESMMLNKKIYATEINPNNPKENSPLINHRNNIINSMSKFDEKNMSNTPFKQGQRSMNAPVLLAGIGAMGLLSIINSIAEIRKANRYESKGCNDLKDFNKKVECLNYIREKTISTLTDKLFKCKDEKCKDLIKTEIDQLTQKNYYSEQIEYLDTSNDEDNAKSLKRVVSAVPYNIDRIKEYVKSAPAKYKRGQIDTISKGVAIGAGIVGFAAAANMIGSVYQKYQWKKKGCYNINDFEQKSLCFNHLKNKAIEELSEKISSCSDDECRKAIQEEIDKLITKKV